MIMWIVIGFMVFVILAFLIITAIKDHKKSKKQEKEKKILIKEKELSNEKIVFYLSQILKENNKLLNEFKPSIGDFKMKDIKEKAKKALILFQNEKEYKDALEMKKYDHIISFYKKLINNNSNVWNKKFEKEINEINEINTIDFSKEKFSKFKQKIKKIIQKVYK